MFKFSYIEPLSNVFIGSLLYCNCIIQVFLFFLLMPAVWILFNLVKGFRAWRNRCSSQPSFSFTTGNRSSYTTTWIITSKPFWSLPDGCLSYRPLYPTINWTDFHMPHLAGAVVECVAVDGASLPVLDLKEAGTFGGAAVLQWLSGWGPALGRRLERAHESLLHALWTVSG